MDKQQINSLEEQEPQVHEEMVTAGIIVIGDEILKGHIQDTNSHYLCKELWKIGIMVSKISVVGDSLESISKEVRLFSKQYDYVLTSGGIGPTHDDVTMEGIGKAFNEEMICHPDMIKLFFGDKKPSPDNAWIKTTIVPNSTTVHIAPNAKDLDICPLLIVKNVYPFPGIPTGLRDTFQAVKHLFTTKTNCVFYLKQIFFTIDEDELAHPLRQLQEEYTGKIDVGSYPNDSNNKNYIVKVTLEGRNKSLLEEAYCRLLVYVSPDTIISVINSYDNEIDKDIRQSISWLSQYIGNRDSVIPIELCRKIKQSVDIMNETLDRYSHDQVCVAFNGGKDCTVLLHLFHSLLEWRKVNGIDTSQEIDSKIKGLYVSADNPFQQVEDFISVCIQRYNIDLIKIQGSIQSALEKLKLSNPKLKAVLMGTRFSDPYSESLESFSLTDSTWPQYMRVHCILNWSYCHIWLFLRIFRIPYCILYDKGYTSLGNSTNTVPNPTLYDTSTDTPLNTLTNGYTEKRNGYLPHYLPAFMLQDESLERSGRIKKL